MTSSRIEETEKKIVNGKKIPYDVTDVDIDSLPKAYITTIDAERASAICRVLNWATYGVRLCSSGERKLNFSVTQSLNSKKEPTNVIVMSGDLYTGLNKLVGNFMSKTTFDKLVSKFNLTPPSKQEEEKESTPQVKPK